MSKITFQKQEILNGFLPIRMSASNGDFSGSTEANIYPDEFKYFAKKLISFLHEPGQRVLFSSGGDEEGWTSYLYLEAYLLETDQQPALQVRIKRNEPESHAGGAAFIIACDRQTINRLGQELTDWLASANEQLVFEM